MPPHGNRLDRIEAILEQVGDRPDRGAQRLEALDQRLERLTNLMLPLTPIVRRHEDRLGRLEEGQ